MQCLYFLRNNLFSSLVTIYRYYTDLIKILYKNSCEKEDNISDINMTGARSVRL